MSSCDGAGLAGGGAAALGDVERAPPCRPRGGRGWCRTSCRTRRRGRTSARVSLSPAARSAVVRSVSSTARLCTTEPSFMTWSEPPTPTVAGSMLNSRSETITDSPVDVADPLSSSAATRAAIVMTTASAQHGDGAEDQRQGGDVTGGRLGGREARAGSRWARSSPRGSSGGGDHRAGRRVGYGRGGGPWREGRRSQSRRSAVAAAVDVGEVQHEPPAGDDVRHEADPEGGGARSRARAPGGRHRCRRRSRSALGAGRSTPCGAGGRTRRPGSSRAGRRRRTSRRGCCGTRCSSRRGRR